MSTPWHAAGFGTDPEGDAARRASMASARITPGQWERLGRLTAESDRHMREAISRALGSSTAPDAEEVLDRYGPDLADDPGVPGHHLTPRRGGAGTEVTCECGRWEGWYNGARSRRRVLDDHAVHTAAELAAEGPIIVESVRLDLEETDGPL